MNADWSSNVLSFWFDELGPAAWFVKSDAVDAAIRDRFLPIYEHVTGLAEDGLIGTPADMALAGAVVLDQFPRNMFRGSHRMFESDGKALALAEEALAQGLDQLVPAARRLFFYLPFEHSEALADQDRSVELFEKLADPHYLAYAEAHRTIVRRFGRFPHRNALLGRPSTPDETAFLAEPGSSF